VVQIHKDQDGVGAYVILDQPLSSSKLVTSKGRDIIRGIQSRFVYQFASYEPMEDWEVEKNTNIDVFEETKENYFRSSKYAETYVNVLDEVP
jgi:hypothetical protein